jgi:hypothetical protein
VRSIGLDIVRLHEPVYVARIGRDVLVDVTAPDHDQHAWLARAAGLLVLEHEGVGISARAIEGVARELFTPPDLGKLVIDEAVDFHELEVRFPNIPIDWLEEAVEAITDAFAPPPNVLPFRTMRR